MEEKGEEGSESLILDSPSSFIRKSKIGNRKSEACTGA